MTVFQFIRKQVKRYKVIGFRWALSEASEITEGLRERASNLGILPLKGFHSSTSQTGKWAKGLSWKLWQAGKVYSVELPERIVFYFVFFFSGKAANLDVSSL